MLYSKCSININILLLFHYLWGSRLLNFFPLGHLEHWEPGVSWGEGQKTASVRNQVPFHGLTLSGKNLIFLCSPGRCVEGLQASGLLGKPLTSLQNGDFVCGQRLVGRTQQVIASEPLQGGRRGALHGRRLLTGETAVFKRCLCVRAQLFSNWQR